LSAEVLKKISDLDFLGESLNCGLTLKEAKSGT
jgi:hypothetical protein